MKFKIFTTILLLYNVINTEFKVKKLDYDINKLKNKKDIIEVAIIGSGPGGLSAALYAARGGYNPIVFQGPKPGGQLTDTTWVENWPGMDTVSGAQAIKNITNQAKKFGAVIVPYTIEKVDFSDWPFTLYDQNNKKYNALTVIIATGATPRKLNVEGEKTYWGKGMLSCGICDAPLTKNQNAIIVGGGDAAIERAMQIAPYAKKIILLVRGDKMKASKFMQDKLKAFDHIKVYFNKEIIKILGDTKHITGAYIKDTNNKKTYKINTNWVFLSIGFIPDTNIFKGQLDLDQDGYIEHECKTQQTSIEGVYVAGNACDSIYKQAGTASGDGSKAGLNAIDFLSKLNFDSTMKPIIKNSLLKPEIKEDQIKDIKDSQEFENKIKQDKKTFVIFYSSFCSTCNQVKKILENITKEFQNKLDFVKVDKENFSDLHEKYKINIVPTFVIFKNSKEISKLESEIDQIKIKDFIVNSISLKN